MSKTQKTVKNLVQKYREQPLKFHFDAGHGWLEVPFMDVLELGIEDRISSCSYQKGDSLFLEEDCDCMHFQRALTDSYPDEPINWEYMSLSVDNGDFSTIRNYDRYPAID
jgi:hypothetical protein